MLTIDIEKQFNLKKLKLDLHKELNEAGKIIRKDHSSRLERGMGVSGPLENLADSTVEAKGFDQILVNTGKMKNLVLNRATKANKEMTIHPGKAKKRGKVTNQQIGSFHQEGGGNLPKREWFGITRDAEKKSLRAIELKVERILRRL